MDLGWWGSWENLGRTGGGETVIRIYGRNVFSIKKKKRLLTVFVERLVQLPEPTLSCSQTCNSRTRGLSIIWAFQRQLCACRIHKLKQAYTHTSLIAEALLATLCRKDTRDCGKGMAVLEPAGVVVMS